MQWPWRKPPRIRTVYVPVASHDPRPFNEKLSDPSYAQVVESLGTNSYHNDILIETLRLVREAADGATSPEELRAYGKAIGVIKSALTLPQRVKHSKLEGDDNE